MSDARWLDVGRFFSAAAEHFRMAVLLHEQGGFDVERARLPIEGRRPAILSEQAAEWAEKTRRFRHVATRNYNNFRPQEATGPVDAAKKLAEVLPVELAAFRDAIDPPSIAQDGRPG